MSEIGDGAGGHSTGSKINEKELENNDKISKVITPKMVLEHQGLLSSMQAAGPGLQPALQLYAAAAQLAPRSRVPPWAPFLQFGAPGLFNPFLARPRFPAGTAAPTLNGLAAGLNGLTGISHSGISPQRTAQGPPSEDSNDDRGEFFLTKFLLKNYSMCERQILCAYVHAIV